MGAWSNLTLSFIGRANLLKMIAFPKLLCCRPCQYTSVPGIKSSLGLLYGRGKSRINFPDIKNYNLSTNLCVVQDWISGSSRFSPLTLEEQMYPSISLINLLHSPYSMLPAETKVNPMFMAPLCTWLMARKRLGLSDIFYNLTLIKIPQFQHCKAQPIFPYWSSRELSCEKPFGHSGEICTFY